MSQLKKQEFHWTEFNQISFNSSISFDSVDCNRFRKWAYELIANTQFTT